MRTIFWNVDTQYDFMKADGKLYVQGAEQIEENLAKLSLLARRKFLQIVNTADWHNENSEEISDSPDFKTTFPPHCMIGTRGAEYVSATNPKNPWRIDWRQEDLSEDDTRFILQCRNIVLYKDKFDVFAGTPYADKIVSLLAPERAVVYGVATNVCVDFAVKGLLERKVQVYVPTDAIKELPGLPLPYEEWQRHGAILTKTSDIEKILE